MPVRVRLATVMEARRITGRDLSRRVGISETQLSLLKSGRVRGVRFDTMARLCAVLDCRPGDLLDYEFDEAELEPRPTSV